MKKYAVLGVMAIFILSGCSIDIDTGDSKTEEFANKAEELGNSFELAKSELETLHDKKELTTKDQKVIVEQINNLTDQIDKFKDEDSSLLAKMTNKVVGKELMQKEEVLLSIKEKAEKDKATEDDVRKMIETLSADYEVSIFK